MNSENDLIKKLMVSKAIMDKHNEIPRAGNSSGISNTPSVESFEPPAAKYNLPQDLMTESNRVQNQSPQPITKNKILSSKLPDEIKQLMIEHPIVQSNPMVGTTLSNELVEKASRLMNVDASGKQSEQQPKRDYQRQNVPESVLDNSELKNMVKEAVREILSENGLITESVQKANDVFSFRVGKHIFEGKVTKIKKVQ